MGMSRRFFLKSGTLTAVCAGVGLNPNNLIFGQSRTQGASLGFPIPTAAQQEPTYMFTRATFEPYIGDYFQAPNALGRPVGLKLVSVTPYSPSARTRISTGKARETDSFALSFKADGPLPQFTSIHKVSHPRLGQFDLFLKPNTDQNGNLTYEAVFDHI
jgi:hypothetical protein